MRCGGAFNYSLIVVANTQDIFAGLWEGVGIPECPLLYESTCEGEN